MPDSISIEAMAKGVSLGVIELTAAVDPDDIVSEVEALTDGHTHGVTLHKYDGWPDEVTFGPDIPYNVLATFANYYCEHGDAFVAYMSSRYNALKLDVWTEAELDGLASDFEDAYQGEYDSEAKFTEELIHESGICMDDVPSWVVIDYQATWDCNLRHDYTYQDGYVFRDV